MIGFISVFVFHIFTFFLIFFTGVTIGFDPASLLVNETDGTVTFTIRLLSGTLERSVLVNFFTTDGSATSTVPQDFVAMSNVPLEFSATTSSRQVTVTIINDNILENVEFFYGNLSTSDGAVQLSPATARATILELDEDDGKVCTRSMSGTKY